MSHALGGTVWDSTGFHHASQNSAQFKTHELFTSGIFRLIFSYCGWLQVITKTKDKGWRWEATVVKYLEIVVINILHILGKSNTCESDKVCLSMIYALVYM